MIAKLLFSDELKQVINNLATSGKLRQYPLKAISYALSFLLSIYAIFILLILFYGHFYLACIIFIACSLSILYLTKTYHRLLLAFAIGERQKVKIVKLKSKWFRHTGPLFDLYCTRLSDNERIIIPWLGNQTFNEIAKSIRQTASPDDEIYAYVYDKYKSYAVLDSKNIKQILCLREDLMNT